MSMTPTPPTVKASEPRVAPFMKARRSMLDMVPPYPRGPVGPGAGPLLFWLEDYATLGDSSMALATATGHSALCWPHGLARRERHKTPGERADPFRQRSSSARHDPIGVAISHVSEEQRLGAVVSSPHRERARYAQAHDRGLGAQAFDRLVAAR